MNFNLLKEFKKEDYPKKTNILCYHCCYKFKSQPISLPFLYENGKFYVKYVFCSWECMKAYNSEMNSTNSSYIYSLIQLLYKQIESKVASINFAPPKCLLKDFGGHMTIDEFRKDNKSVHYNIIEYPIEIRNPKVEKVDNYSWINEESAKNNYNKNDNAAAVTLKRPVTVAKKKTSLEDAMGLLRVTS